MPGVRDTSSDCLAGVDVPEALIDGFLLSVARSPVAAAARSACACDTLPRGAVPPACACVEALVQLLPAVEGVGMLRVLTDEEERWRREGVGWVAPVIWWLGLGSPISMGSSEAETAEADEALLATEADWARRAVSSRVKRLT